MNVTELQAHADAAFRLIGEGEFGQAIEACNAMLPDLVRADTKTSALEPDIWTAQIRLALGLAQLFCGNVDVATNELYAATRLHIFNPREPGINDVLQMRDGLTHFAYTYAVIRAELESEKIDADTYLHAASSANFTHLTFWTVAHGNRLVDLAWAWYARALILAAQFYDNTGSPTGGLERALKAIGCNAENPDLQGAMRLADWLALPHGQRGVRPEDPWIEDMRALVRRIADSDGYDE